MSKQVKLQIKTTRIWYRGHPILLLRDVADINYINSDYEVTSEDELLILVGMNIHCLLEKLKLLEDISLN